MINKPRHNLTAEEISNFIQKNYNHLYSKTNTLPKDDYIYLQYICSFVKKNHQILRQLSTEELNILTNNTCYKITGLTPSLAKEFISKESYEILRDTLLKKNQTWMSSPLFTNIFNICMREHTYSSLERDTIVESIWEYKRKDEYDGFQKNQKEQIFNNPQILDIFIRVFTKFPEKIKEKSYNYELGTHKVLKHISACLFYMNEDLSDKFVKQISTINEDAILFILNHCQALASYQSSYFKQRQGMLDVQEQKDNYYNQFPFPNKAQEILKDLIHRWEEITLNYFHKPQIAENFGFILSHSNLHLFNSSLKLKLFYDNSGEKMRKFLICKMVYNYCDRASVNMEENCPAIPQSWEIDILHNDDNSIDFIKILPNIFQMRMPRSKINNLNILFHFSNPNKYPLNTELSAALITSLENKVEDNNSMPELETLTNYFINYLGYSFFHQHALSNNIHTKTMVTMAMEKELLAKIPINNSNRKTLKF